jgi:DNA recombination protein RmuC
MEAWPYLITLLGGVVLGAAVAWALLRGAVTRLRADLTAAQDVDKARSGELAEARRDAESWRGKHQAEQLERARFETEVRRVPVLEARVTALAEEVTRLTATNAQLQTQLQEQAQAHAEKIAVLTEVRGEIEKDLKNITADALRANQGTFLQLANEVFEKHKTGADAELEAREKAVAALVNPLRETLQTYKLQVDEMEKARSQSYGVLSAEL